VHHLVGVWEVAEMLDRTPQWVHVLRKQPGFPEPVVTLHGERHVWHRADIQEWGERIGLLPFDEP
jgi:hypothetical protein